jgi:hypothetical protein
MSTKAWEKLSVTLSNIKRAKSEPMSFVLVQGKGTNSAPFFCVGRPGQVQMTLRSVKKDANADFLWAKKLQGTLELKGQQLYLVVEDGVTIPPKVTNSFKGFKTPPSGVEANNISAGKKLAALLKKSVVVTTSDLDHHEDPDEGSGSVEYDLSIDGLTQEDINEIFGSESDEIISTVSSQTAQLLKLRPSEPAQSVSAAFWTKLEDVFTSSTGPDSGKEMGSDIVDDVLLRVQTDPDLMGTLMSMKASHSRDKDRDNAVLELQGLHIEYERALQKWLRSIEFLENTKAAYISAQFELAQLKTNAELEEELSELEGKHASQKDICEENKNAVIALRSKFEKNLSALADRILSSPTSG